MLNLVNIRIKFLPTMDMDNRFEIFWDHYSYIFDQYITYLAKFCQRAPITHDIKDIVRGIFWILDSGSQWRNLPKEFPLL